MEVLLILLLIVLNGLFAMTELALAACRRARLSALAAEGDRGARAALELLDQPDQFLSTIQIGITSIGVLNGIIGEAAFSPQFAAWMCSLGTPDAIAHVVATGLVVTIVTFLTIVCGELVPKRIGQLYPETVSRWMSQPMQWLARIARPFVSLLAQSTAAMLRLLRIDTQATHSMTEAEISASLEEGLDAGVIEAQEHQMMHNVLALDDRPLTSMMVPRSEVDWLDADATVEAALARLRDDAGGSTHSWYPVCRGSLDEVLGKISVARLLELGAEAPGTLAKYASEVAFVPETLSGMELLEQLRLEAGRMVLVVDEYGVVQGLLTPHDLLEAITGELQPASCADAWAVEREDGSWLLDGVMPVAELKSRLGIDELPLEQRHRYHTLAGFLMATSGHLLATGETVRCGAWQFEVVDLDGRRVDKVLASRLPTEDAPPS
ncbi:hemolysin family protein [Candidatus Symbiobacter mobilis]|uniref:Hemolysin-like protein n=1 Tax=Candidatus Symbiobacter mobilis CR TaxID=946483 RepID=U5NAQ2_9BURK|nr:hemolysin family protein [Candidatus Symbiobacter mobilis]AGX87279.1 hemolysin-like protein [Candidatus Symbiobacter mobilis CR]